MEKIIIEGGKSLKGEVFVGGAKNATLPLLCACLLAKGVHIFKNVPKLTDVLFTCKILEYLGCKVSWEEEHVLRVEVGEILKTKIPYKWVSQMRASILFLGPVLARCKQVEVSFPGGCAIGVRPVDYHIKAMKALGAKIQINEGYIEAKTEGLKACEFVLEKPSVGATENLIMAACLAKGKTVIKNAAREPEITDLIYYLKKMGALITGETSDRICIEGVKELKSTTHSVIPDRIEAATLMIAAAITKSDLSIKNFNPKDLMALNHLLKKSGFSFEMKENSVRMLPCSSWKAVDVHTGFYPDFPTDIQAQMTALMSLSKGKSKITEKVFENRFMHVPELNRMGAKIKFFDSYCLIEGTEKLQGACVMATDLRASSSLILAGLAASGKTEIKRIYHLDRGYEKLDEKLKKLGAIITRKKEIQA